MWGELPLGRGQYKLAETVMCVASWSVHLSFDNLLKDRRGVIETAAGQHDKDFSRIRQENETWVYR